MFPPLALVPLVLSKFLAEHVNGQLRHLLLGGSMLDGGSLASHLLTMLVDVPWWCPLVKALVVDVSGARHSRVCNICI